MAFFLARGVLKELAEGAAAPPGTTEKEEDIMATTGRKFLKLSKAMEFRISEHALDRVRDYTGFGLTHGLAMVLFRHGRQLRVEQVRLLGYRPRYWGRKAAGEPTWYFAFRIFGEEMLAVVGEGEQPGEYVWLTTYGVNEQTRQYRVANMATVAAA